MGILGIDDALQNLLRIDPEPPPPPPPPPPAAEHPAPDSRLSEFLMGGSLAQFRLSNSNSNSPAAQNVAPQQPQPPPVDTDKVEFFFDRLISADSFATVVSDDFTQLNAAEKMELVAMVVRSDRADHLMTSFHLASPPNLTYDAQRQLATALGEAYRQGKINDADLRGLAERLGERFGSDYSAHVVNILAQEPANLKAGGVVEAYGRQARALGQDTAAALAFSSSEELIRRNLTTLADRRAAFAQVRSFVEETSRVTDFRYGTSPYMQSQYVQGLGNAARLHSWPGVSTDAEIDAMFEKAGPRYVQEAIARSSRVEGDDAPNSALNVFGDASRRQAQRGGDEQRDWYVNSALAYTQSPALIRGNLGTPQQRMAAFDLLNHELAGSRDAARDAAEDGYTLLRAPAVANGLSELLAAYPDEIIGAKLNDIGNFQGQADLVNFFESTIFSPYTSPEVRTRIQGAIESYIAREIGGAGNDSQVIGNRVGGLLGVLEVGAQHAVDNAKKPEEEAFVDKMSREFAKTVLSAGVSALLKPTGPVGSLVGGFVLGQIIDKVFEHKPPSPDQLGDAYISQLETAGQNINLGEDLRNQYVNLLTSVTTELNHQRDVTTGAQRRSIDDASFQVSQLMSGIRATSREVVDSYQLDVNGLNRALDDWDDNYKPTTWF